MKLSESYARSIIDAVEMGASEREISQMLNDFLADKVKQTTKFDCSQEVGIYPHPQGDYVMVDFILTD